MNLEEILLLVCNYYDCNIDTVKDVTRKTFPVKVRKVFIYCAYQLIPHVSEKEIADALHRERSTISWLKNQVRGTKLENEADRVCQLIRLSSPNNNLFRYDNDISKLGIYRHITFV